MTKRGAINLISIVAGAAVILIAKHISNKGTEVALETVKRNRNDYDAAIFDAYNEVSKTVDEILNAEKVTINKQLSALNEAYDNANKKAQNILFKERMIAQTEYNSLSEKFNAIDTKASAITATEESLVKDICKSDDAYKALKSAKKALKKSGESTDKIDVKLQNRKDVIKNSVISGRSDEELKVFNELDSIRKQMYDSEGRKKAIIANRSEEEKAIFKELEYCKKNLSTKEELSRLVVENRSSEDIAFINKKYELLKQIRDIEEREKNAIDKKQAFADQLSEIGFNKVGVFALGMIPVVPVCLAVSNYISWLFSVIKKM